MAKFFKLLFLLNGLLLTGAIPQYEYEQQGGGGGGVASGGAVYNGAIGGGESNGGGGGGGPVSAGSSASGGAPSSNGGGSLTVQCKGSPDSSGKVKYDCSGVNKESVTLKTEHILWLESQAGGSQNLDIEIPNYNIDEFIKAAYKQLGSQEAGKINVLLKKPEITYNAAKDDKPAAQAGAPIVSVNYQPVDKLSVHYPTQKQYSSGGASNSAGANAGSGPASSSAFASAAGGGSSSAAASVGGAGAGGGIYVAAPVQYIH